MPTIQIGNQTFSGSVRDCIAFIQAQAEDTALPKIDSRISRQPATAKAAILTKNGALICWTVRDGKPGVKRTISAKAVADYRKVGAPGLNLAGSNGYSRQAKEARGSVTITWKTKVGTRTVEETAIIPTSLLQGDK